MQRLKKSLAQKAAPKRPEWPSYGNFCNVTQDPHFLKKCKGGTKGNFSKIVQKVNLVWKAEKHSGANGIMLLLLIIINYFALKGKRLEKILAKTAALKVPEWPSYGNFCKVTQKPHILKKCKPGTKANFSKIAQKDALPKKAQKHTGANGIIL